MGKNKTTWIIFLLAVCGVLFSGYLSFSRLLLQACPLNEACSYFLGIPTCLVGFVFYVILLFASGILLFAAPRDTSCLGKTISVVSLMGVVFSGYYTIVEVFLRPLSGSLGLPSCAYGFLMFLAIFVLSMLTYGSCCRAPMPRPVIAPPPKPEAAKPVQAAKVAPAAPPKKAAAKPKASRKAARKPKKK